MFFFSWKIPKNFVLPTFFGPFFPPGPAALQVTAAVLAMLSSSAVAAAAALQRQLRAEEGALEAARLVKQCRSAWVGG